MSGTVDLTATVYSRSLTGEPVTARLSLGDDRLSIEGDGVAGRIDLSNVFDVRLGPPPQAVTSVFDGTVLTVGFERNGQRAVLFVGGEENTLTKVAGLLYRRLLDGEQVAVRHPAEVGGRVTGATFDIGTLHVVPDRVGCTGVETPFELDLATVVDFSRSVDELLGDEQPIIRMKYVRAGVAVSLDLALNPPRRQHLLGRHLQRSYVETRRAVRQLEVPSPGVRALTRLYTRRGSTDPQSLLSTDPAATPDLLRALVERDLVEVTDDEVALTPRGWILVTEHVGTSDGSASTETVRPQPATGRSS